MIDYEKKNGILCNTCGTVKDLNDFFNQKHNQDGKNHRCKECFQADQDESVKINCKGEGMESWFIIDDNHREWFRGVEKERLEKGKYLLTGTGFNDIVDIDLEE